MSERRPLFGLLLAGGRSRRMGQDKALLERHGQSQLQFAMALLEEVTEAAFVSTRNEQAGDAERAQFSQIVDRYEDMGPVAGILSALEAHPEADWLVLACDLPNLDKETLVRLIERQDSEKEFTAYRSSYDELPEPLCAIYRSGSATTLRSFVDAGIHCPRKILIRSDTQLLEQPDPQALDNINTPEDLAASILDAPL